MHSAIINSGLISLEILKSFGDDQGFLRFMHC